MTIKSTKRTNKRSNISASIRKNILEITKNSEKPVSTLELSEKIGRAWHSIQTNCLKLQLEGRLNGFKVGNMNLWVYNKD